MHCARQQGAKFVMRSLFHHNKVVTNDSAYGSNLNEEAPSTSKFSFLNKNEQSFFYETSFIAQ